MPSNREFPKFFKTYPTLICMSIFRASRRLQKELANSFFRHCNKNMAQCNPAILLTQLTELLLCSSACLIVMSEAQKSKVQKSKVKALFWLGPLQPNSCQDYFLSSLTSWTGFILMGKMVFRKAKCLVKVVHTMTMETGVLNIQIPVRIVPCPPWRQLQTL